VEDEAYLWQVILYVHLNPVRAGLVQDPGEYSNSGHREILRGEASGTLGRDQALLCFGPTRRSALRRYRSAIEAAIGRAEGAVEKGRMNGAPLDAEPDEEPWFDPEVPYVDVLGRSTARPRPQVSAERLIPSACDELGIDVMLFGSASRLRDVVRCRRLIMALGVERWGLRAGLLGAAIGRFAQQISVWAGEGTRLRRQDAEFKGKYEELDTKLLARFGEAKAPEG